jgi:hypothetical protein
MYIGLQGMLFYRFSMLRTLMLATLFAGAICWGRDNDKPEKN